MVAINGQAIAVFEGYVAKEVAMKGIESVKQNASMAVIEDKAVKRTRVIKLGENPVVVFVGQEPLLWFKGNESK